MANSLVIEFLGQPGVGKSYLAEVLCNSLRSGGLEAWFPPQATSIRRWRRALQKAGHAVIVLIDLPLRSASALRVIVLSGQHRKRDIVSLWVNWLYLQRQLALGMGHCVVVFDQGFLQNLWSVYLWASGSSPGDGMASLVGTDAADLVVVVSAPDEVIEARLAVRRGKQSRRERLNVAASKDLADRGKGLQEEVIEAALSASIPARKIIHVTNDRAESPSKAVLPILAEIRAMQDWRGI